MYEKPALNRVGDAREVILGAAFVGNDVDSTWVPGSRMEMSGPTIPNCNGLTGQ